MPYMQAMVERLNTQFNRDNIGGVNPELLAPGTTLANAAQALGIARSRQEMAYISALPAGQQEALRAALYSALSRRTRLPVTVAWAPGYDYELNISEAAGTRASLGGLTVLLRGPTPAARRAAPRRRR